MTGMTTEGPGATDVMEPRLWRRQGWTARVIKNEDDDGWAVEMTRVGDSEPALVGPWTMGRDKKNPKPLDQAAFLTLVKTATEVLTRAENQRKAALHRSVTVESLIGGRVRVDLDIIPDEDDPHAVLTAWNAAGHELARLRVRPDFKLNLTSAMRWVDGGFSASSAG
ncbi:MAG: hypothetical protein AB2A00_09225 [Myxococcota bacterium]